MKNKDEFYLKIAETIATASYAKRTKVGALLEKDGNIIAFGYNGTPAGFDNCCETVEYESAEEFDNRREDELITKPEVLHAESNAIAKCARSAVSSEGATLYTLYSPCMECAKLIIQAGIKRVVYQHDYRIADGLKLLIQAGIKIQKYECQKDS